jgi:hypothetical protein
VPRHPPGSNVQKLLLHLDSSNHPSVFDRVVAFDGGADQVMSYGSVTPNAVRDLVHGALFTRGLPELRHTAIFVGGADMAAGEHLLTAVRAAFFGPFSVSVMLDSNGANTTAVAAVTRVREVLGELRGLRAVVTAGSGPVGSRVAGLLAAEGVSVAVTSRRTPDGSLAARLKHRFNAVVEERLLGDGSDAQLALRDADIIVNAGPAGVCVVPRAAWSGARMVVDLNAVPPAGIEGVEPGDKAKDCDGVICFGALGVGSLKMKLHRACIAKLFERNDLVLDAETIASIAHELSTPRP